MDLSKILEVILAAVVGWIALMEVRWHRAQSKIISLEEKTKDDSIKSTVKSLSDAELDALLSKDLSPKRHDT